jgi:hypothetical protein
MPTCISAATSGRRPWIENSVVPMANAARVRVTSGRRNMLLPKARVDPD